MVSENNKLNKNTIFFINNTINCIREFSKQETCLFRKYEKNKHRWRQI